MGGNAFKSPTRRVATSEYNEILKELLPILEQHYSKVDILDQLPTKLDHGDIDILVSDQKPIDLSIFNPAQVNRQGPIHSFEYKNVQVDLLHTKDIQLAKFCLSYSDFGVIFGYLLKPHNLKLNENGLVYKLYTSPNTLEILHLSSDPQKICECFELDCTKYGFENEQQVFEWFGTSWQIGDLQSTQKRQEKKRGMFSRFLVHYKQYNNILANTDEMTDLAKHCVTFFDKNDELEQRLLAKPKLEKLVDGERVMKVLALPPGKTIGKVLGNINQDALVGLSEQEIDDAILNAFNSLKL
ncbi:hypothetical protein HDV06_000582 [Boothiomyces sp. JEL0866]|nr:hypothetical protein HDV06_000582 [Boothiomyces sp. JEL0866]